MDIDLFTILCVIFVYHSIYLHIYSYYKFYNCHIKDITEKRKNQKQYKNISINKGKYTKVPTIKNINDNNDKYTANRHDESIKDYYEKLHYYDKKQTKREYTIKQITDTELRVVTGKIQELYRELGFNVKVIDIVKKKYITEYEIIFSQENTQTDILSVSNEVIDEFQIDGVKIIRNTKKDNRIYIQIPLKYEETLT